MHLASMGIYVARYCRWSFEHMTHLGIQRIMFWQCSGGLKSKDAPEWVHTLREFMIPDQEFVFELGIGGFIFPPNYLVCMSLDSPFTI